MAEFPSKWCSIARGVFSGVFNSRNRPSDVFIAVMGVTGSGKSSFISMCSDTRVEIGHTLEACELLETTSQGGKRRTRILTTNRHINR